MDQEVATNAGLIELGTDRVMWSTIILFIMGATARTLISDEPFCFRKFLGEMIFAAIGGVIMYSFGLLQGMSTAEIVFFGGLASLGGVRLMEWLFKIARSVKENS